MKKNLCDNKKFQDVVKALLSNQLVSNEKITLVEDYNIAENNINNKGKY